MSLLYPDFLWALLLGIEANKVAFRILENNGLALDAIEKGLNITR